MQEKVSFMVFSVRMEMSAPRDNCFGGNSAEPRYPPNTVIPRDGNFDSHLKPMKDTYILAYRTGFPRVYLDKEMLSYPLRHYFLPSDVAA